MKSVFTEVDPKWAWSFYEPGRERAWDAAAAAHLFRRVGLGANTAEIDEAVKQQPADVVVRLVRGKAAVKSTEEEMDTLGRTVAASNNPNRLAAWWLHRMVHGTDPALERLTLFWHGHFATSGAKVENAKALLTQHELLRRHARGKFEPLVQGISRDPAMLSYLDSTTNRKVRPNENYARELLELFCLGLGNYTERDIQETARAFTGWEVRDERFRFSSLHHDTGEKSIFGKRGAFDGDEAVRVVLAQPAAARFIAGKLFRYYVADEPSAPAELIEPLAVMLRENDFEIGPVVELIAGSALFFSPLVAARRIRGPVELAMNLVRALETQTSAEKLADDLSRLGQAVFFPPNVKGWDGGRAWLNSSTLLGRANLVRRLVNDSAGKFAGGSLAALAQRHEANSPSAAVSWLLKLLVAADPPAAERESLEKMAEGKGDPSGRYAKVIHAISTLPEFQLA